MYYNIPEAGNKDRVKEPLTWHELVPDGIIKKTSKNMKYPEGSQFRYINGLFTRIDNIKEK